MQAQSESSSRGLQWNTADRGRLTYSITSSARAIGAGAGLRRAVKEPGLRRQALFNWSRAGAPNHQQNPADLRQQGQ